MRYVEFFVFVIFIKATVADQQPQVIQVHKNHARRLHESQNAHHIGDNKFVVHNMDHLENLRYVHLQPYRKNQTSDCRGGPATVYCNPDRRLELAHELRLKGMKPRQVRHDKRVLKVNLNADEICNWLHDHVDVVRVEKEIPMKKHNNILTETLTQYHNFPGTWRGLGEIITVADTQFNVDHCAFGTSNVVSLNELNSYTLSDPLNSPDHLIIYFGQSKVQFASHGTHCAATAAGLAGSYNRAGVAYDSKIIGLGFPEYEGEDGTVYIDLVDVYDILDAGYRSGSRIASFSWGTDVNYYSSTSRDIDQFMYEHDDMIVFVANGNTGDLGSGSVGSPATAKNCVGVGMTRNENPVTKLMELSSYGPTLDGRQKPEILAPGYPVNSADGGTMCGAISMGGTSMATPAAAGVAAITRQYLREELEIANPASATVRAVMFVSANKVPYLDAEVSIWPSTDQQGYGEVYAKALHEKLQVFDRVTTKKAFTCTASSYAELVITWTDLPSDLYAYSTENHLYLNVDLCVDNVCTADKINNHRKHEFEVAGTYNIKVRASTDSGSNDPITFSMATLNANCIETVYATEPPVGSPTVSPTPLSTVENNKNNEDTSLAYVIAGVVGVSIIVAAIGLGMRGKSKSSNTEPLLGVKYKLEEHCSIKVPNSVHNKQ